MSNPQPLRCPRGARAAPRGRNLNELERMENQCGRALDQLQREVEAQLRNCDNILNQNSMQPGVRGGAVNRRRANLANANLPPPRRLSLPMPGRLAVQENRRQVFEQRVAAPELRCFPVPVQQAGAQVRAPENQAVPPPPGRQREEALPAILGRSLPMPDVRDEREERQGVHHSLPGWPTHEAGQRELDPFRMPEFQPQRPAPQDMNAGMIVAAPPAQPPPNAVICAPQPPPPVLARSLQMPNAEREGRQGLHVSLPGWPTHEAGQRELDPFRVPEFQPQRPVPQDMNAGMIVAAPPAQPPQNAVIAPQPPPPVLARSLQMPNAEREGRQGLHVSLPVWPTHEAGQRELDPFRVPEFQPQRPPQPPQAPPELNEGMIMEAPPAQPPPNAVICAPQPPPPVLSRSLPVANAEREGRQGLHVSLPGWPTHEPGQRELDPFRVPEFQPQRPPQPPQAPPELNEGMIIEAPPAHQPLNDGVVPQLQDHAEQRLQPQIQVRIPRFAIAQMQGRQQQQAHHGHEGQMDQAERDQRAARALRHLAQLRKTPSYIGCELERGLEFLDVCDPKPKGEGVIGSKIPSLPLMPCLEDNELDDLLRCERVDVDSALYLASDERKTYKKPCPKQQKAQSTVKILVHGHPPDPCVKEHAPLEHPDSDDISPELAAAMVFCQEKGIDLGGCPKHAVSYLFPEKPQPPFPEKITPDNVSVIDPQQQQQQEDMIEQSANVPSDGVSDSAYTRRMSRRGEDMGPQKSYDVDFAIGQTKREYVLVAQKPRRINKAQFRGGGSPPWFPGYFSAFPDEDGSLKLVPSPSQVFHKAWIFSKPANIPTSDVIVLD